MPVIRDYKTTADVVSDTAYDATVTAQEFERFLAGDRVRIWDDEYADGGALVEWSPGIPAGYPMYGTTVVDEALMRSNWDALREMITDASMSPDDLGFDASMGQVDIPRSDVRALAMACKIERDFSDYPVLDDEAMSHEETRLINEGIDEWFRDDVTRMFDEEPAFDGIFGRDVDPDGLAARALEDEIRAIAYDAVSYCGELYIDSIARHVENTSGGTVEEYAARIRRDLAHERRVEFEKYQKPLMNEEV